MVLAPMFVVDKSPVSQFTKTPYITLQLQMQLIRSLVLPIARLPRGALSVAYFRVIFKNAACLEFILCKEFFFLYASDESLLD
jgi:hypothetical protein